MTIRTSIEQAEPLTGTATAGERRLLPVGGWLGSLGTLSLLVGTRRPQPAGKSVLVHHQGASVRDPGFRATVAAVAARLGALRDVTGVRSPLGPGGRSLLSPDGHSALVQFEIAGSEGSVPRPVFAILIAGHTPDLKQMGLGLAVPVLLDATVIRGVLLPATMELFGKWNWYLPRPLERLIGTPPAASVDPS